MKKNFKGGFTLIELLVVIAIIGILASVVLASLNTARAKGADANIKANLANARAQAELFYDSSATSSYAGVCASGALTINALVDAASKTAGTTLNTTLTTAQSTTTSVCHENGTAWAASVPLKQQNLISASSAVDYYCVDSSGAAKTIDNPLGGSVVTC
jgi:prepilin-type N-terminal cleavage/methylation domain-containing protein